MWLMRWCPNVWLCRTHLKASRVPSYGNHHARAWWFAPPEEKCPSVGQTSATSLGIVFLGAAAGLWQLERWALMVVAFMPSRPPLQPSLASSAPWASRRRLSTSPVGPGPLGDRPPDLGKPGPRSGVGPDRQCGVRRVPVPHLLESNPRCFGRRLHRDCLPAFAVHACAGIARPPPSPSPLHHMEPAPPSGVARVSRRDGSRNCSRYPHRGCRHPLPPRGKCRCPDRGYILSLPLS